VGLLSVLLPTFYVNKRNHSVPRYKTRAATTPSNSFTLSFIDEQRPGDRYSNAGAAMKWKENLCGLGTGFLKSPDMAGVVMPRFYREK
jgi:hypothetical protein